MSLSSWIYRLYLRKESLHGRLFQTYPKEEMKVTKMPNRKTLLTVAASLLCATIVVFTARSVSADQPEWQKHVDWSIGNTGAPDCADQYVATEPKCLAEGNRSCLMARAIDSAKHNNCSYAMRLTLITQCHNAQAQQAIGGASEGAVCAYLKSK